MLEPLRRACCRPCSNIYLHEVVDRWFEDEVRPRMRGATFATRYADDFIFVFASREDAERFALPAPRVVHSVYATT